MIKCIVQVHEFPSVYVVWKEEVNAAYSFFLLRTISGLLTFTARASRMFATAAWFWFSVSPKNEHILTSRQIPCSCLPGWPLAPSRSRLNWFWRSFGYVLLLVLLDWRFFLSTFCYQLCNILTQEMRRQEKKLNLKWSDMSHLLVSRHAEFQNLFCSKTARKTTKTNISIIYSRWRKSTSCFLYDNKSTIALLIPF